MCFSNTRANRGIKGNRETVRVEIRNLRLYHTDQERDNIWRTRINALSVIIIKQRFYTIAHLIIARIISFEMVQWTLFASIFIVDSTTWAFEFIASCQNTRIRTFSNEPSKIQWLFSNAFIWGRFVSKNTDLIRHSR